MFQEPAMHIHGGFPKTATTFLQKHVFPKLDGLQYTGRHYLSDGEEERKTGLANKFRIAREDGQSARPALVADGGNLLRDASCDRPVPHLFSAEGIIGQCMAPIPNVHDKSSPIAPPTVRQALSHARDIAVAAGFAEPRLIMTLRRQEDLLTSFFAEAYGARLGRVPQTDSFDKYCDEMLSGHADLLDDTAMRFDDLDLLCRDLFGDENVLLLDFGWLKRDPALFAQRFGEFVGIDPSQFSDLLGSGKRENVRRSSGKAELQMRRKTGVNWLNDLKKRFVPNVSLGIGRKLAPLFDRFETGDETFAPAPATLDRIRSQYADNNARFVARHPDFDFG